MNENEELYKVVCFYRDGEKPAEIVKMGLTLEQAQFHCSRPDTDGDGWFHGYCKESEDEQK